MLASEIDWTALPDLSEAHCCNLKIETDHERYWVCRHPNSTLISKEVMGARNWEAEIDHQPANKVDIPNAVIPDVS